MGLFGFFRGPDMDEGVAEYQRTAGAVLLDVRTPVEYRGGHAEGSVNLPLSRLASIEELVKDRSTPLYVYCRSGSRSGRAAAYLKKVGYVNAKNIGGIIDYPGRVVRP